MLVKIMKTLDNDFLLLEQLYEYITVCNIVYFSFNQRTITWYLNRVVTCEFAKCFCMINEE